MNMIRKLLVAHFDVVSFDIFDTLLERNVAMPQEIFRLAGKDVLGREAADIFLADRINAERKARQKHDNNEITLAEIYLELQDVYKDKTNSLMQAEIRWELASCHPKIRNVEWMKWCLEKGKKVLLISDMYLPPEIIKKMLEQCNIWGYQKFYVSCFYRENKITGNLFRIAIEENQCASRKMVHLGDSLRADIMGAHKAGVFAIWLPRRRKKI